KTPAKPAALKSLKMVLWWSPPLVVELLLGGIVELLTLTIPWVKLVITISIPLVVMFLKRVPLVGAKREISKDLRDLKDLRVNKDRRDPKGNLVSRRKKIGMLSWKGLTNWWRGLTNWNNELLPLKVKGKEVR